MQNSDAYVEGFGTHSAKTVSLTVGRKLTASVLWTCIPELTLRAAKPSQVTVPMFRKPCIGARVPAHPQGPSSI